MKDISIKNAAAVSGMTLASELEWLASHASRCSRIAEIGSWKGRTTRAMADNMPEDGVLYAVDTWKGIVGPEAPSFFAQELDGKPAGWLKNVFLTNVSDLYNKGIVIPLEMESPQAARTLRKMLMGAFDMIFIDAAHDYASIRADIEAWRPLLAPAGLFCGHDYHDYKGRFPGVDRAVDELIDNPVAVGIGSLWYEGGK